MTLFSHGRLPAIHQNRQIKSLNSRRRAQRRANLEILEDRTLLSYIFSKFGSTASAVGTVATDSLVIAPIGGLLQHSVNGGAFDSDWGGSTVPAAITTTLNISYTTGDGSSVQLGGDSNGHTGGPASDIFADIHVFTGPNTSNTMTLDDSAGSTFGSSTYTIDTSPGTITGPGINYDEASSFAIRGGVTLKGTNAANTYNVLSVLGSLGVTEPVSVIAGSSAGNVINVGSNPGTPSASVLTNIGSALYVSDPAGTATLNLFDAGTTNSTAAGITSTQITGLGLSPFGSINYVGGASNGISSININGGTNGGAGVTYNLDGTASGTTTTINGGKGQNIFNLSNPSLPAGLDNLPGAVVVHGGSSGSDIVTLDDSSANFNDTYTVTSTTVARVDFGGLTYDGIGTLTLFAENTLGTNGNNIINIASTANSVTTNIRGQGGTDTVTVTSTGSSGVLNITANGTVNVLANNEPVNISSSEISAVNIGSSGGPGTMANILFPIGVLNPPSFTTLTFHDELDTTARTWTLDNNDTTNTATIAVSGGIGTTTYRPGDMGSVTINGGSGGNTFLVNNTTNFTSTTLNTGTGSDLVNVFASGTNTLSINGQGDADSVNLGGSTGAVLGMQGLNGSINVSNTLGFTTLKLDDSQDLTGQTSLLSNNGVTGQVTGLSPATIQYTNTDIQSLTVLGGSGSNTYTVNGTLANGFVGNTVTNLNKGPGVSNTVNVFATNLGSQLNLVGLGTFDTVNLGALGSMANILGNVTIDELAGSTILNIDASADAIPHNLDLTGGVPQSTLTGFGTSSIVYTTNALTLLTISTSPAASQFLHIHFAAGNPIPTDSPFVPFGPGGTAGLVFNAGADGTSAPLSHGMTLDGTLPTGPFTSEIHNANDDNVLPHNLQAGSIAFTDTLAVGTRLNYTGLQPIADVAGATNYTFNDLAVDPSFSATNGPTIFGFDTIAFVNTPAMPPATFETTYIANKTNVVFATPTAGAGLIGTVDITTPSTGLASLTFNTNNNGDNIVNFVNTPAGVATALNGGTDEDVTNVLGVGVPSGTTLILNGAAALNTLTYDAGGLNPVITPGSVPGRVVISLPGFGSVDATNYQTINIINVGPLTITPGLPRTINTIEGFNLTDAIVGTFVLPLPAIGTPPAGMPAGAFTASINWGDPSPDLGAGTITQDASNPSLYYVTGTHTFAKQGTYTVNSVLAFTGGSYTSTLNEVSITVNLSPAGPTAGTSATANVTQGTLAVTAFPIVGVEGIAIASGPIASFIDAGGISSYTATITIKNAAGATVLTVPAASITQIGTSAQFVVNAPAITLPEAGTYQVVVSVTDDDTPTPQTASGVSVAVIADAALTAGAPVALATNTGTLLASVVVGTFTDGNTTAPASDFTAVIDWGDGSPTSLGTIVALGGGAFSVQGTHIYLKPGSFATKVVVQDVDGASTTLDGTAAVTDLAVTGAVRNISAVEGLNTGTIVLATFSNPNPFATVDSVTATLLANGWGDGTPGSPVALTVTKIGSTATTSLFQVTGNHTYADEGTYVITISVTTSGGVTTALTNGSATVVDAKLAGSSGTVITGVEGSSTGNVLLGTFTDANLGATVADFTVAPGSTVINWGDGSAPQTLTAANIVAQGTPEGVVFTINAPHTYATAGVYAYTITVTDEGGSVTIVSGSAVVSDAALIAGAPVNLTTNAGTLLSSVVVATFTDGNTAAPASDFTAVIDWGDGSPTSLGTIVALGGGAFNVLGTHTYVKPGNFATKVVVQDIDGAGVTLNGTATVTDLAVTGSVRNFTAIEGINTGTIVLATFVNPNPSASIANVTATLVANGWGDGTPGVPVALTVTQIGSTATSTIFAISGSHTYAEEGTYTVNISVTTTGGVTTALTPATATVIDAKLTSSNGTQIHGIEGNPTANVLLGTFSDANPGATIADFTVAPGSTVVEWGDGSAPQTLTAANLTANGSPDGVVFSIRAPHTYAEAGTYDYTITVTDEGGSVTIISGVAVIADAKLTASPVQPTVSTTEAAIYPVPQFSKPAFKGAVGSFIDGNPLGAVSDFTATIDWGDGTAPTSGTISQPGGIGTAFVVSGGHTYADSDVNGGTGSFDLQIFVVDTDGSRLTISNTAAVADRVINLIGRLSAESDSGKSNTDAVTYVAQPNFYGTSEPFSDVVLFANGVSIGQTEAGSDGAWNITSSLLADGSYTITATARDQFGVTTTASPTIVVPTLVIDTVAPRITYAAFNRLNGTESYTFQDLMADGTPGGSGLWTSSLGDSANYALNRIHTRVAGTYVVTTINVVPGATVASQDVAVVFNKGVYNKGGYFQITARSKSSLLKGGIQDLAGNALDGEFYGKTPPSGNGVRGGDFVAKVTAIHLGNSGPVTILGYPHPTGTSSLATGTTGTPKVKVVAPPKVTKTTTPAKNSTKTTTPTTTPAQTPLVKVTTPSSTQFKTSADLLNWLKARQRQLKLAAQTTVRIPS